MRKWMLAAAVWVGLQAGSAAQAASVGVVVQLNPDQSGPIYGWSLRISTAGGVAVGEMVLMLTGFDSFDFSNPVIEPIDSPYVHDPVGDGRDLLVLNPDAGQPLVPGGTLNLLLGTLSSHFSDASQVKVENADAVVGAPSSARPPTTR